MKRPRIRYGLAFGATVWASGYVVLPAAKLYKPIWEYDRQTLGKDLSAHLVYGLGTATAFQLQSTTARQGGSPLTRQARAIRGRWRRAVMTVSTADTSPRGATKP